MDFTKITKYLDSLEGVGVPGCDLAIYKDHTQIYRHFTGYRDREAGVKLTGNDIYWIFSLTKLHTCAAALQLIESGQMGLDDPVSRYLPAFGLLSVIENGHVRAARGALTIRHLFTMQGGFNYNLDTPSIQKACLYSRGLADMRTIIDALAEEPLDFDPGTRFQYSLCHDVLAAVIEAASGMRFGEYLKEKLWRPLGIESAGFSLTDCAREKLCKQYIFDDKLGKAIPHKDGERNNYQLTSNYESGGAGLYCSVDDYMRLADALACAGVGATGARILKGETIDLMRTNQLSPAHIKDFTRPGYGYGLGVRTLMDTSKSLSPLGEFGWDGAACGYVLIDPENRLSAFFGMQVRNFGYGYEHVHPTIRDMIYRGLEQ